MENYRNKVNRDDTSQCVFLGLMLLALTSPIALSAPFTFDDKRKLKLTDQDFRQHVLPQIKGIKRDFFSLFNHQDELYPKLLKGRSTLFQILEGEKTLASQCGEGPKQCEPALRKMRLQLLHLETLLNGLENGSKDRKFMAKHPNRYTLWAKKSLDLHSQVLEIIAKLQRGPLHQRLKALPPLLHQLRLNYENFFFDPLGEDKKKLFTQVYYSFIRPLDQYVLAPSSKDYLKKNAEALNFAWNDFHVKISKSNRIISIQTLNLAQQIHRRWVAVLRAILHR